MNPQLKSCDAFIQARHYTKGPWRTKPRMIVIHDMEAPELDKTAENVARYFATTTVKASAHFCVDNNSTIQDVDLNDIAWHAPGANHMAFGIEHAGYASQNPQDWDDAYSKAMLQRSSRLAAELCAMYGINIEFLDATDLKAGATNGFTTHAEVSKAFKRSTHHDPGLWFPMNKGWAGGYLAMVRDAIATPTALTPTIPMEDVTWKRTLEITEPLMHGEDVKAIQKALKIPVTGFFDHRTVVAVALWQQSRFGTNSSNVNAGKVSAYTAGLLLK